MLKRLIYHLLENRHYWRHISFSEVAELYMSRTLRMLAVSMVNVFVAVYLYQNGYNLTFIMAYFCGFFVLRALVTIPFAFVIARIGPKHTTLLSNFLYVPALLLLTLLPEYGILALSGFALFQAISVALYDMSYLVNFSKIRVDEYIGKEIGYMHMLERIAGGLSPVVGGFIAFLFGPQATLICAAVIFALAALPLLFTPEPVQRHQKITYHGIPWRKLRRPIASELSVGADFLISGAAWSLFVALAIFGETTNSVYAKLGLLAAITMIAAIVSAKVFGIIVDRRRGRELLQFGVGLDSLVHIARPFASTPLGAVLINALNEIATTAYAMPFTKGMFDMADRLPGYRIVFMSLMSCSAALGAALCAAIISVLSLMFNEINALQIGFVIVAFLVLGIAANGFPALARKNN